MTELVAPTCLTAQELQFLIERCAGASGPAQVLDCAAPEGLAGTSASWVGSYAARFCRFQPWGSPLQPLYLKAVRARTLKERGLGI